MLNVPIPGRFVRPPALYHFKHHYAKVYKILFISPDGVKIKLKIDDKGNILTPKPQNLFKSLSQHSLSIKEPGLRAAFKTNRGIELVTVKYNGISVHSKTKFTTLFHRSRVIHSSFAPTSDNFFTLDEEKKLMFWPFLNPYESPKIISRKAEMASWFGNRHILVLQNNTLISCDVLSGAEYEFPFPPLSDCFSIFVNDKDVYAICRKKIVSKTQEYEIGEFKYFSFSAVYNDNFLFIFSTADNQLHAFLFPSFTEIPVDSRNRHDRIDSVSCMSLSTFVVLSNTNIEVWNFLNDKFEITYTFEFAHMNGMICDKTSLGGRIFTFDSKRIYLIDNGIIPFLDQADVTSIATSYNGHFVAISQQSMHLFPMWTSQLLELREEKKPGETTNRKDVYLNVDYMTQDSRFLLNLSDIIAHNFMPSPAAIVKPTEELRRVINMTLAHLLEFSQLDRLDRIDPQQVPAIPAQYANTNAISEYSGDTAEVCQLQKIVRSIREDVDMYGLRYLAAVKSSNWPPAYIGLWLSFSVSQSQICNALQETVTTNNLTKFFLAIGVHSQSLLEDLVKRALARTWAESKKIDPVAVYYIAMSNVSKVSKLYEIIGDTQRSEFFKKDFTNDKNRRSALKNAYSSLSRQNFLMASALFLIAGDVKSCIQITYEKLNDPLTAFLLIRLIDKRLSSDVMQWFLNYVKWSDSVIPVIIANLMRKEDVSKMMVKLLTDSHTSQNTSSMGDRRIAIYQIYHRLTNDSSIVPKIAHNLVNDGLAPLANYLLRLPKKQMLVQASISSTLNSVEENTAIDQNESEDFFGLSGKESSDSMSDDDFDFGSKMMDDWSEEYDSDTDSEEEESENDENKGKIETINSQNNSIEQKVTNQSIEFLRNFLVEQIEAFSRFYTKQPGEGNNDDIAAYALHYGFGDISFSLFSEVWKNLYRKHMSKFIDYCGAMYIESAQIPASNRKLLELSENLAHKLTDASFSFDKASIMSLPNTGFSHSVLFGSFASAAWSFEPRFVDQLLSDSKFYQQFTPKTIPHACSVLDADIGSPRFPDTVPQLVMAFSRTDAFHSTNIESARFIVMFLIFRRLVTLSKEFKPEGRWHRMLNERYNNLIKTLEMYQIAQSAPSIIEPCWTGKEPQKMPLIDLVKEEYETLREFFKESHFSAFRNLPFPSIFRNGKFSLSQTLFVTAPFEKVTACSLNPQNSDLCALASGSQVAVFNVSDPSEPRIYNTSSFISGDIFEIVSHPTMHIFLTVSASRVKLFDFYAQNLEQNFELPTGEKIVNAAFSPSGNRLAIITEQTLSVFLIDLSHEVLEPCFTQTLKNKPVDLTWVGTESIIAVAFQSNIRVIDTLSLKNSSITILKEWGVVTTIRFNTMYDYIVVGTKKGFTIVFDARACFETVCVITCNVPIVSLSHCDDVFAIAAEKGQVSMFSTIKLGKLETYKVPWNVKCVAVSSDFVIAAGDSKSVAIWRAE